MSLSYRFANQQDYSEVVELVNAAYRGDENYPGWTHEGHLLEGARISLAQLTQQLNDPQLEMLLASEGDELSGCMMLSVKQQQLYLGTFAVQPQRQGQGVGRQMLQHAEALAVNHWHSDTIEMVVISQRVDLIAYYQRRGYQLSSDISDFPVELDVGIPKVEGLTLRSLSKSLSRESTD